MFEEMMKNVKNVDFADVLTSMTSEQKTVMLMQNWLIQQGLKSGLTQKLISNMPEELKTNLPDEKTVLDTAKLDFMRLCDEFGIPLTLAEHILTGAKTTIIDLIGLAESGTFY